MHITLVNPSSSLDEEYGDLADVGSTLPPLGLLYLAGSLEEKGHKVVINDALIENLKIKQHTDLVGITATTPTFYRAVETAMYIRETFGIPIVLGGPHITAVPTDLNEYFDYGVMGEGEITFTELINLLEHGKNPDNVRGICFRKRGVLKVNDVREYVEDLDVLPYPAYHLVRFSDYRASPSTSRRYPVGDMITGRGCPFKCVFCDRKVFGNRIRLHSPERVVSEFRMLVEKQGVKEIRFWDDTFNVVPRRVMDICRLLKEEIGIEWSCLARINNMNHKLIREMRMAGCWQISYGIESGNQGILDLTKKNLKLENVREVVDITKAEGIETRGFFMLGLPNETAGTMQDTINFATSLNLDIAQFYVTIPFPGTELYDMAYKTGELKTRDWRFFRPNFPDNVSFVPNGLSEEEIMSMQRLAYKRFYLRPEYILKQIPRLRERGNISRFISVAKVFLNM